MKPEVSGHTSSGRGGNTGCLLPASPATRSLPPPCAGAHCTAPRRMGLKNWSHVNLLIFLPQPPITLIYHVAAQMLWGCQNHTAGKGERGLSLPAGASNLHQIWSNVDPHPTLQACGLEMCISWLEQWWNKAAWQHRSHSEHQSQAMELTQGANMELTVGPVAISISPVASCSRHAMLTQVMCFLTWVIACINTKQAETHGTELGLPLSHLSPNFQRPDKTRNEPVPS